MEIKIYNCNNIDFGKIKIIPNNLNIKYGVNGTGKTTITKAILNYISDKKDNSNSLAELTPYKWIESKTKMPKIEGLEENITVKIFDEEYIKQFIFTPDEILKNSFEIFIKTKDFLKFENNINVLLKNLKKTFENDKEVDEFLLNLDTFFTKTKTASSAFNKALRLGNQKKYIPEKLNGYTNYIQSDQSAQWLSWHSKGENYLKENHNCPYCTTIFIENGDGNKEKIKLLSETYNSKDVSNQVEAIKNFASLETYFSEKTNLRLKQMMSTIEELSPENIAFLKKLKIEIEMFLKKIYDIKNIDYNNLKDSTNLKEKLNNYKIKIDDIHYFNSSLSITKITKINKTILELEEKVNPLLGEIKQQTSNIKNTIQKYSKDINSFLKMAGYSYEITFELQPNKEYKMKLKDFNSQVILSDTKSNLSYGETNALALILFMYDALNENEGQNSNLIILDDPISSFDKNKKCAIIERMFAGKEKSSLKGKTVLLLTHDFEPVIDSKYNQNLRRRTESNSYFLKNNSGQLKEEEINVNDIKSCVQSNKQSIEDASNKITKLIFLRRLREIEYNNCEDATYNYISCFLHKKNTPKIKKEDGREIPMTTEEKNEAKRLISKNGILNFNYKKDLLFISSDKEMKKLYSDSISNYEKLQLYRIIIEDKITYGDTSNNILKNFLNKTYHIENDFLYQLNPIKFDVVPNYIIKMCNENLDINDQ